MKKGIITLIALALLAPLTLVAQTGPGDGPFCPQGRGGGMGHPGMGHRGMGQGHSDMLGDGLGRGHRGDRIGVLLRLGDEIGLTDDQRDRLETMQVDFQMASIDHQADLKKAQVTMHNLIHDDDASKSEVMNAIDNVSSLKADMQKMRYTHRKQIREVLTDEQVEKLKELRKERFEDRPGRGQGRMGKGRRG